VNEPYTLPLSMQLLSAVNIQDASNILEVACGPGLGTKVCEFLKPSQCSLTAVDFSPEMVHLAKQLLEGKSVNFLVANAESLPFEDNHFDKYFASLALNLVPNPEKMLSEAYRVLKKGGAAAFSIWGRSDHSVYPHIVPKVFAEFGIDVHKGSTPPRSNFHLGGDLQKLRELLEKAGFTNVIAWYQPLVYLPQSGKEFSEWILNTPNYIPILSSINSELKEKIISRVINVADECLGKGEPLNLDVAVVVGKK